MSLESQRREYDLGHLSRESLNDSPFTQFEIWLNQALAKKIQDPTAMSVATVGAGGKPWQRMVLLKGVDEQGFIFYTNTGSRKAAEILGNPQVSLLFPWLQLDRQVIIGGHVEALSKTEALKYFFKRPTESQLAALASQQSRKLSSRKVLEMEFARLKDKLAKGQAPTPDFWGGYRVIPEEFEFWQGGEHRLHDRFQYLLTSNGDWDIQRLAP